MTYRTAVGFFLLWLAMFIREKKPFAKELKWFFNLTPWHKFIVICVFCFFTLWGGSKERGILPHEIFKGSHFERRFAMCPIFRTGGIVNV